MIDPAVRGKTFSQIADMTIRHLEDKYGELTTTHDFMHETLMSLLLLIPRENFNYANFCRSVEVGFKHLIYTHPTTQRAIEERDDCWEYVEERLETSHGATVHDRIQNLAHDFFSR